MVFNAEFGPLSFDRKPLKMSKFSEGKKGEAKLNEDNSPVFMV